MKEQSGFTLIELVIVVVILGFLAVTAIPKFIDLTDQAKQANIEGMAGGFATGVSLVRAQWEAEGRPDDGTRNIVSYDGTTLALTDETANIRPGYPVGISGTNGANGVVGTAAMTNALCIDLWQSIFTQPPSISSNVADLNNANLSIDYLADTAAGGNAGNNVCAFYLRESLNKNAANQFLDPTGSTGTGNLFTYDPSNSSVVVYINNN
ncbi:type II secretion system protein [Thalassotalea atypica]|uniref:type II secretion system protein n=1 Tax=Thalassotalea atypica TaxID=2054316 RepID=UPI0025723431|nr:type II secretion system protein [Thalassotalea atypica]